MPSQVRDFLDLGEGIELFSLRGDNRSMKSAIIGLTGLSPFSILWVCRKEHPSK
jgi:hypothetical protein